MTNRRHFSYSEMYIPEDPLLLHSRSFSVTFNPKDVLHFLFFFNLQIMLTHLFNHSLNLCLRNLQSTLEPNQHSY